MERENMFMHKRNNSLLHFPMAMQNELQGTSGQLQNCFFNPNWDNSMDQNDTFESALSSMVSSPVTSNAAAASGGNIVLKELIGRLGSISNSSQVSPHSYMHGNNSTSTNNSCYSTPLNSPPKLNLTMMDHQIRGTLANSPFPVSHLPSHRSLGAARYSCFANSGLNCLNGETQIKENKDVSPLQEEKSSLCDQIRAGKNGMNCQNDGNSRKRKSISNENGKDVHSSTSCKEANAVADKNELSGKRSKIDDNGKDGDMKEENIKKENKDDQKDYIHVRARRGQATDAHSLAERVRREKISQRMNYLQDLVPGCNKITGKAVMLDEIINYVQSLQQQVEFLSMKLATINPGMDVNIEALLSSKGMLQSHGSLSDGLYPSDNSASAFPFPLPFQSQQAPNMHQIPLLSSLIDTAMGRSQKMPLGNYSEAATQASSVWQNDLQSVVFGQNQSQF